jgi:hypothetical protein
MAPRWVQNSREIESSRTSDAEAQPRHQHLEDADAVLATVVGTRAGVGDDGGREGSGEEACEEDTHELLQV